MPGYVYRGNDFDATPKMGPAPTPEDPELCGTPQGIWRHRYNKEAPCPQCRERSNADRRANWEANKDQPRKHMRLETIEKLQKAEALFAKGASQSQVQRKTGLGRMTIRQYFPGQGWTKEQTAEHNAARQRRNTAVDNPIPPVPTKMETVRPKQNGPAVATNNCYPGLTN
jgi:hypothetical protein